MLHADRFGASQLPALRRGRATAQALAGNSRESARTQAKSLGLTLESCANFLGFKSVQSAKELPEEGGFEGRLTKLKNLYDKGLITQEQYDKKRGEIPEAF